MLKETKRKALALQRQLEELSLYLNKTQEAFYLRADLPWLDDPRAVPVQIEDTFVVGHLRPSFDAIARISRFISILVESLDKAITVTERKKRSGRPRKHSGLDDIVAYLEACALAAGGTGFAIPTLKPPKGRIVQALDRLRVCIGKEELLTHFADFLPKPGYHPASLYQRVISDVQRAFGRKRH